MRRTPDLTVTLTVALALGSIAGCKEKISPEPPPSTSAGSVMTAAPMPTTEAPIDRSPVVTHPNPTAQTLNVVAYRAAGEDAFFGAKASHAFRIHPFRDTMLVSLAGNIYSFDGQKLRAEPKAVTTEKVPKEVAVLGAYEVRRIEGIWPDTLYVDASFYSFLGARQSNSRDVSYHRAGGQWEVVKKAPTSVVEQAPGVLLGLVDGALQVLAGSPPGPPLKQTPAESSSTCPRSGPLVRGLDVAALPSGEVFVLGKWCNSDIAVVERWAPGQETGIVEDLPGNPKLSGWSPVHHITAGSPSSVFVAATSEEKPYVARWDGRGFREFPMHDEGVVESAFATKDGAVFMSLPERDKTSRATLIRLTKDGEYTRYYAPKAKRFSTLWASDAETAFVAWNDDYGDASMLFGTSPRVIFGAPPKEAPEEAPPAPSAPSARSAPSEPSEPSAAPAAPPATATAPPPEVEPFPAFTDGCATPFVFLYDVSASSPPTFTFPTTRKAISAFPKLEGVALVDFMHRGRRRLGLRVPSAEVGRALVDHVIATMKDEHPKLVCFDAPSDVRVVPLP